MAGFASRDRRSEGTYQDLLAKALALDDGLNRAALITTDLLFFDDLLQARIERRLHDALGLAPQEVVLTASHTHCGPAINEREWPLYPEVDRAYVTDLVDAICGAVQSAFDGLCDSGLSFGSGVCGMAINRRLQTPEGTVTRPNPAGPTDPEVAVLRAGNAVVMTYACHASTGEGYLLGGDYPGFAQRFVEERVPGTHAMFVQGCGGDVKPRNIGLDGNFQYGPLENVEHFGRELASAVCAVLQKPMSSVAGPLEMRRADFDLPLGDPPTRLQAEAALGGSNRWRSAWARRMLEAMDRGQFLARTTRAMVQVLRIGELMLIALSGEIGVEIGLRIKRMFPGQQVMVAAYAGPTVLTDYVMPRHRFPEGGYEVDGNYYYTLLPAPLRPEAEDIILEKVMELTGPIRTP